VGDEGVGDERGKHLREEGDIREKGIKLAKRNVWYM
jgi:hypothetical protein